MTFKNEYILPIDQETSEFAKQARRTLNTGHSQFDAWTIDRERELILMFRGTGREVETANQESWVYLDATGKYSVYTDLLSKTEVSTHEIAITRSLRGCVSSVGALVTTSETIACIKEAIREYSRIFLFNLEHFNKCQLILVDATSGKEI